MSLSLRPKQELHALLRQCWYSCLCWNWFFVLNLICRFRQFQEPLIVCVQSVTRLSILPKGGYEDCRKECSVFKFFLIMIIPVLEFRLPVVLCAQLANVAINEKLQISLFPFKGQVFLEFEDRPVLYSVCLYPQPKPNDYQQWTVLLRWRKARFLSFLHLTNWRITLTFFVQIKKACKIVKV